MAFFSGVEYKKRMCEAFRQMVKKSVELKNEKLENLQSVPWDAWSNFELCKVVSRTRCTLARGAFRSQLGLDFDSKVDR